MSTDTYSCTIHTANSDNAIPHKPLNANLSAQTAPTDISSQSEAGLCQNRIFRHAFGSSSTYRPTPKTMILIGTANLTLYVYQPSFPAFRAFSGNNALTWTEHALYNSDHAQTFTIAPNMFPIIVTTAPTSRDAKLDSPESNKRDFRPADLLAQCTPTTITSRQSTRFKQRQMH